MFQSLYRQDGFIERFRRYEYHHPEYDADMRYRIEYLDSFGAHEIEWFRTFASEGGMRLGMQGGEEYVRVGDLMYYDLFAAKLVEGEINTDFNDGPGLGRTVEVRLDGTFAHGWPWRERTALHPKKAARGDH